MGPSDLPTGRPCGPAGAGPGSAGAYGRTVDLSGLQDQIEAVYGDRDRARGLPASVAWLAEEVGELARAIRKGTREEQLHELSDVVAWTVSLANQLGLSLDAAMARYGSGCPHCGATPCRCAPVAPRP